MRDERGVRTCNLGMRGKDGRFRTEGERGLKRKGSDGLGRGFLPQTKA